MKNILVTGSNGQLGKELQSIQNYFPEFNFFFTTKKELDITRNKKEVEDFIKTTKIDAIINCAAYTNVAKAETEKDTAFELNHQAVKNLAKIAKNSQIKLIHISTDYVFDGNSSTPYTETDIPNPQNIYGLSKWNGEQSMLKINPENSIIIRTSWLYSEFGKNFVKTILQKSKCEKTISVVTDQIGSPTYAKDLAKAILTIIPKVENRDVEIFHFSNKGSCNWFQFAKEIVTFAQSDCDIRPIDSKAFVDKVKRPIYSLLNTSKIEKEFDIEIAHWKKVLEEHISKLNK